MKKVLTWMGIALGAAVGCIMMRYGLPLLMMIALLFSLDAIDAPLHSAAEQALGKLELTHIVQHHSKKDLTIEGVVTAFPLLQYDAVDNDVHAALMAHLATAEGWETGALPGSAYAGQLARLHPEAAFLLPEVDVIFDAWYTGEDALAYFDQDKSLFIYLEKNSVSTPGEIRMDGFTVPHDGYLYELETHGLFGYGETYQTCIVPEEARPALEAALAAHADWHNRPITRDAYIHLHRYEFKAVPNFFPAADVTFDWWCYVDIHAREHPDSESTYIPDNSDFPAVMQEIGARPGWNWAAAFYDVDTGLFIYYAYDS